HRDGERSRRIMLSVFVGVVEAKATAGEPGDRPGDGVIEDDDELRAHCERYSSRSASRSTVSPLAAPSGSEREVSSSASPSSSRTRNNRPNSAVALPASNS